MIKMRKNLELDRMGIERLPIADSEKHWLKNLVDELQKAYRRTRENIAAGGASTANWDIRDATAADVTAGEARAAGNLLMYHKTNGTKHEIEQT